MWRWKPNTTLGNIDHRARVALVEPSVLYGSTQTSERRSERQESGARWISVSVSHPDNPTSLTWAAMGRDLHRELAVLYERQEELSKCPVMSPGDAEEYRENCERIEPVLEAMIQGVHRLHVANIQQQPPALPLLAAVAVPAVAVPAVAAPVGPAAPVALAGPVAPAGPAGPADEPQGPVAIDEPQGPFTIDEPRQRPDEPWQQPQQDPWAAVENVRPAGQMRSRGCGRGYASRRGGRPSR